MASEVGAVGQAHVVEAARPEQPPELPVDDPEALTGVDPVVDGDIARCPYGARESMPSEARIQGAHTGASRTSTGRPGTVSASPGWKTVCSPRESR